MWLHLEDIYKNKIKQNTESEKQISVKLEVSKFLKYLYNTLCLLQIDTFLLIIRFLYQYADFI